MNKEILVLYYSRYGATKQLALMLARGIESVAGVTSRIRTVPAISPLCAKVADEIPESGHPYVVNQDLVECIGLALGSPVRFGNMASPLKYFWDSTAPEWLSGSLVGKPATVFTSSSSLHGGQEVCLLTMMVPLFHHGMLLVGLPYSNSQLLTTTTGGTPYGVSHVAGINSDLALSEDENKLAFVQGRRLAEIALKLSKE